LKNKKALSGVVTVMILIGITLAAGAMIWAVISNLVNNKLDDASSCYGIYDRVQLNDEYTCYNLSAQTLQVSISLKDFKPDSVLISAQSDNNSVVKEIFSDSKFVEGVLPFSGIGINVSLPNEESGKTYVISGVEYKPVKIYLAPKVSGTQCEISDELSPISFCL
jgi:flagellin-like protein